MRKINLVPLAGKGERFVKRGYSVPKPLLNVSGLPMVVQAAKSLPECDKWIFICQKKHLENSNLETILKKNFSSIELVVLDGPTNGQASSCYLSKKYLNETDILTIGSTDAFFSYDKSLYNDLIKKKISIVFGFNLNQKKILNPNMYGWIDFDKNLNVSNVLCKKTISNTPEKDYAVVGSFCFVSTKKFYDSFKSIVKMNKKVNNEFYLDTVIDDLAKKDNVKIIKVNKYVSWGTPEDYEKNKFIKIF